MGIYASLWYAGSRRLRHVGSYRISGYRISSGGIGNLDIDYYNDSSLVDGLDCCDDLNRINNLGISYCGNPSHIDNPDHCDDSSCTNTAKITYSKHGDYLLPNLTLNEPPPETTNPLTKYGRMRRTFLKEHRAIYYNKLLLTEQLFPHLREAQHEADLLLDEFMAQLIKSNPPPSKEIDGLAWTNHMNELRYSAEEIVVNKLIYAD